MFRILSDEVQGLYVMLGDIAGKDPVFDSELRGRVLATKALIHMAYEDVYGESDNA